MHAFILMMKFAKCILPQKPDPEAMINLHVIRQNMALQLLNASGKVTDIYTKIIMLLQSLESLQYYCQGCGMCSTNED